MTFSNNSGKAFRHLFERGRGLLLNAHDIRGIELFLSLFIFGFATEGDETNSDFFCGHNYKDSSADRRLSDRFHV